MNSWNEKAFSMQTFDASVMLTRTNRWTNTCVAGELRFNVSCICLINISRPTCMWNSDKIFYWLFTQVQLPYLPKRIVMNTLFLTVRLTKIHYWFTHDSLTPTRHQAITWTNVDSIHWHIYASLGIDGCVNLIRPKLLHLIKTFQLWIII